MVLARKQPSANQMIRQRIAVAPRNVNALAVFAGRGGGGSSKCPPPRLQREAWAEMARGAAVASPLGPRGS